MATYRAISDGNWSSLAIWEDNSGGSFAASSVLPGVADDVYANGFIVQVDQDINVKLLSAGYTTSVTYGGRFEVSSDRVITAFQIIGKFYTSTSTDLTATCIYVNGVCNVTIIADILTFPLTNTYAKTIAIGADATVNIIGNIYGSTVGNTWAVYVNSNGANLNIVGNLYGGISIISHAIYILNINSLNITGNLYAGTYPPLVILQTCNILVITGNVSASSSSVGYGINIAGTVTNLFLYGNAYSNATSAIYSLGNSIINIEGNQYNNNGVVAVFAKFLYWNVTSTTVWEVYNFLGAPQYLYGAGVNTGHPIEADVRKDVVYGPNDEFEGTLAVPPPATVNLGVPTDDTVGTWVFDDDLIERLGKCATTEEVDSTVAAYNS